MRMRTSVKMLVVLSESNFYTFLNKLSVIGSDNENEARQKHHRAPRITSALKVGPFKSRKAN